MGSRIALITEGTPTGLVSTGVVGALAGIRLGLDLADGTEHRRTLRWVARR
jgi:hypothetical protein